MNHYVISTLLYGLVALLGLAAVVLSVLNKNWLLVVISVLVILVALDNFFCGLRARMGGCPVHGHYVIPPFLKFWEK